MRNPRGTVASMTPKSVLAEPQNLADFHELGKFLYYAKRFATNELVKRTFSAWSSPALDPSAIERLEMFVRGLLDVLSSRQRTIIERYEFADEACAVIAKEIGISTRHFWREHRDANSRLAELLQAPKPPLAVTVTAPAADAFEEHLRLSRVLDHNGRDQECIALLERLADGADHAEHRADVELRLSDLYRERGRATLARHHAENARMLAKRVDPSQGWREFEVEAAFAPILESEGDRDHAMEILQRCTTQLRSWAHRSRAVEAALAHALCYRALLHVARFEYRPAAQAATDARAIVLRLPQSDPYLQVSTQFASAFIEHILGPTDTGRDDYLACYQTATANGLTRESLKAASAVGMTYLLESQPERALIFLEPLLETAKSLVPSEASWDVLGQAVRGYIQLGNFTAALAHIRYMKELTITDFECLGLAHLLAARLYLKLGDYAAALSESEAAETISARIGSKRPLRRALLFQSEALIALGRFAQARRLLRAVIAGDDPRQLAQAYDLMAVVSDDRKYSAIARELRSR